MTLTSHFLQISCLRIPVPDAEAERSIHVVTPRLRFDLGMSGPSSSTSNAATQSPIKRTKLESIGFLSKNHILNDGPQSILSRVPRSAPSAGCKWSSTNWSYDTFKKMLRCASSAFTELTEAFETLMENDSNLFSQDLFDTFRDEFRDRLNAEDSIAFPRVGQVGASVVSILENLLPNEIREFGLSQYYHPLHM